jgi:hypothetical protein
MPWFKFDEFVDQIWFKEKNYVENEGFNFNAMINALKWIISCEFLGLEDEMLNLYIYSSFQILQLKSFFYLIFPLWFVIIYHIIFQFM